MKRIYLLLLIPMLAAIPLRGQMHYILQPTSSVPGQVVAAFTGGSANNTCIWYFPMIGSLPLSDLFDADASGTPPVILNIEDAHFMWVSTWSIDALNQVPPESTYPVTWAVIPAGPATIYYSADPKTRHTDDPTTWGVPVATFSRGAGLFHSPDGFSASDRFYFSAKLLTSRDIKLHGKTFNFRQIIPNGMTCFEYGKGAFSANETGVCVAMGN